MATIAKSKWNVDVAHSSVDFTVKHMMIAKVKGSFHSFEANIEADPADLTSANIGFTIDLSSVDTRTEDRDNHLRSADFFDVEKFPKLIFKSTSIERAGEDQYNVTGDVTLHGVTHAERFVVTFEGSGKDPWGNEKVAFSAVGSIKRSDYGLTWNAALETGGVLVGDEIKIALEIEASAQA
jgi:polyisoprenoid-binding protein YceI